MQTHTFRHPNPVLKRLVEVGALVVCVALVLSAGLLLLIPPLVGAPSGFLLASPLTLLLAIPVLMLTVDAPAVTVSNKGLSLHPVVWKDRFVPWDEVVSVDVYPLLPHADTEITRRYAIGKRRYRPAQGIMLLIPSLPLPYRIAGFLAGTGARPIIALTNRAHVDYDHLLEIVLQMTDPALHNPDLYDFNDEPGDTR